MMNRIVLVSLILVAKPLAAHHSFAAIDRQSEAFVRGTVTEFQFRNPHTFIFVDVPQEDGQAASWRIEGETRNDLFRNGWRDDSLQPGDAVTVHVRPARDPARRYAQLLSVEKADGTEEHLNLRVALQPVDLRWDVALYADNATDNRRFLTVGSDPLGYDENILVTRVKGATYRVQARWNFGTR